MDDLEKRMKNFVDFGRKTPNPSTFKINYSHIDVPSELFDEAYQKKVGSGFFPCGNISAYFDPEKKQIRYIHMFMIAELIDKNVF
jgi:hypothetical protein